MTLRVRLPSMAEARSVSAALSAALLEEQAGWLIGPGAGRRHELFTRVPSLDAYRRLRVCAEAHGCRPDLELQLAKRRADQHPSDAIAVYLRHLDYALEPAKDDAYAEVVRLLTLMRPLHQRLGQDAAFDRLVTEIRAGYKRRRNLIKRLDLARR